MMGAVAVRSRLLALGRAHDLPTASWLVERQKLTDHSRRDRTFAGQTTTGGSSPRQHIENPPWRVCSDYASLNDYARTL